MSVVENRYFSPVSHIFWHDSLGSDGEDENGDNKQEQDNDIEMAGAGEKEKKPHTATAQAPKKQDPSAVIGVTTAMQRVSMN